MNQTQESGFQTLYLNHVIRSLYWNTVNNIEETSIHSRGDRYGRLNRIYFSRKILFDLQQPHGFLFSPIVTWSRPICPNLFEPNLIQSFEQIFFHYQGNWFLLLERTSSAFTFISNTSLQCLFDMYSSNTLLILHLWTVRAGKNP